MSTRPPLAVELLIGLAGVSSTLVKCMELDKRPPARMAQATADKELSRIAAIIEKMADPDIFVWLSRKNQLATMIGKKGGKKGTDLFLTSFLPTSMS